MTSTSASNNSDKISDENEVSLSSTFAVVYVLHKGQWLVNGRGWAEVHLYKDETDGSFRLVGWTVKEQNVVLNVNLNENCSYNKKTNDFHKFIDEHKKVHGFGFSKLDESYKQAQRFLEEIHKVINHFKTKPDSQQSINEKNAERHPNRPMKPPGIAEVMRRKSAVTTAKNVDLILKKEEKNSNEDKHRSNNKTNSLPNVPPRPISPRKKIHFSVNDQTEYKQHNNDNNNININNNDNNNININNININNNNNIAIQPQKPPMNRLAQKSIASPDFHSDKRSDGISNLFPGEIPMGKLNIHIPKPNTRTEGIDHSITQPTAIFHTEHVEYDKNKGRFTGLPKEWEEQINKNFGVPLSLVNSIKIDHYTSKIPHVLISMKKYLFEHDGHLQEGIFRLAPDQDECAKVKKQLNDGSFQSCNDVNCISNLLKVWFRDLPVQLLQPLSPDYISSVEDEEQAITVSEYLPEPNKSIFFWLLDLCVDISNFSNVNKMNPQNMAIVFAPNLFSALDMPPMESLLFSQKVAFFMHKAVSGRKMEREGGDHDLSPNFHQNITSNNNSISNIEVPLTS